MELKMYKYKVVRIIEGLEEVVIIETYNYLEDAIRKVRSVVREEMDKMHPDIIGIRLE